MKLAYLGLALVLTSALQARAAVNPLDLTSVYKAITCTSDDHRKIEYDGATRKVVLVTAAGPKAYSLVHLKKTTSGAELLARDSNQQHLLAFIDMPNGKTLVQVDGTSFYATCTVTKM